MEPLSLRFWSLLCSERSAETVLASEKFDVTSLDANFTRVAPAAESVGVDGLYSALNKHLSKIAHPIAMLVRTLEVNTRAFFRSLTKISEFLLLTDVYVALEEFISAI